MDRDLSSQEKLIPMRAYCHGTTFSTLVCDIPMKLLGTDSLLFHRAKNEPYIASMGIYVCKATAIHDLLVEHFPTVSIYLPSMSRTMSLQEITNLKLNDQNKED